MESVLRAHFPLSIESMLKESSAPWHDFNHGMSAEATEAYVSGKTD